MNSPAKKVTIFTDGSCRGNPGPGGWAALLRYNNHEKTIYGAEHNTTNNRMELLAAIAALAILKEPCIIDIITDSQYLRHGVTKWLPQWKSRNWRTSANKPVKNVDLWQRLDTEAKRHKASWHWVKSHNGHPENELVDALAKKAIAEIGKQ